MSTPVRGVSTLPLQEMDIQCVDTLSGRVDTRPSIQKTLFVQMGQCVDTLSGSVDTLRLKFQLMIHLDTRLLGDQGNLPRFPCPCIPRHFMDIWGYKYPCSLYPKGKRAHTLPGEAFWRQKGAFQILLHLQKLQAILSRGRTWESRGISGEKLAVLGKGADSTEEEQ
ncbi:hypothetical protein Taro_017307 [Colocasia esculenta]|uniref:Uncharacterized protein n=1 Tax=Colocasia esculenta TaxID=4460 RepID=A0A843UMT6_COLES|nr:hypothetical protein [Colocasia esculenta]